jgi:hypothetical protein
VLAVIVSWFFDEPQYQSTFIDSSQALKFARRLMHFADTHSLFSKCFVASVANMTLWPESA